MKKRFTEEQIVQALRQADSGMSVKEVCRQMGVSEATYYYWKKKFRGMQVPDIRRMRSLEVENGKLKRIVADLTLDNLMLKEINSRKW